jgi:hypothetical protein
VSKNQDRPGRDTAAPAPPKPGLPKWQVSGVLGHEPQVIEADSEAAAIAAYLQREGILATEHTVLTKRIEE